MTKFSRIIIGALLLAAAPATAQAEPTAREFLDIIDKGGDGAEIYKTALHAYGTGLEWAHSAMTMDGAKRQYCPPQDLSITSDKTLSMVRAVVKAKPKLAEVPAGLAVWMAYLHTFPC